MHNAKRSSEHISLFTPYLLCVVCRTLATDVNMHDLGVCSPPNGRTVASTKAMMTTSWYLLIFNSSPKILAAGHTNTHTQHNFVGTENT